jgi:hypothetical protein
MWSFQARRRGEGGGGARRQVRLNDARREMRADGLLPGTRKWRSQTVARKRDAHARTCKIERANVVALTVRARVCANVTCR